MESGGSSSCETSRAGSSWLGIEMILRVEEYADEDTPTPGDQAKRLVDCQRGVKKIPCTSYESSEGAGLGC
jgi:hypothetical protein